MKFFYHKLGKGNHLAEQWLDETANRNPLKRPAIVAFFGLSTRNHPADLKKEQVSQVRAFYESSDSINRKNTFIAVIAKGHVWILQPDGEIIERENNEGWSENVNLLKIMPVKILAHKTIKDVPHVLASINANTFLSQGTYREIANWGNQKAICAVIGKDFPAEHWKLEECTATQLLECLSSTELETLVAKLFEAAGCFVPAHRGGVMVDADLFAHNDSEENIQLDTLVIPKKGSLSIQVKSGNAPKECPPEVDCLIALDVKQNKNCFDGEWLLNQVQKFQEVKWWLRRSLNWLPEKILVHYGI